MANQELMMVLLLPDRSRTAGVKAKGHESKGCSLSQTTEMSKCGAFLFADCTFWQSKKGGFFPPLSKNDVGLAVLFAK